MLFGGLGLGIKAVLCPNRENLDPASICGHKGTENPKARSA